jgi:hypothetical protein
MRLEFQKSLGWLEEIFSPDDDVELIETACATIAIVADALLLASAELTAATVTSVGAGTAGGAVYRPTLVTVPQTAPLHPEPSRLHMTAVFEIPDTAALNCCVEPVVTDALVGVTTTAVPGTIVTVADADAVGSPALRSLSAAEPDAFAGLILSRSAAIITTVAKAVLLLGPATLVAVTATMAGWGGIDNAAYKPALEIVPHSFPP